MSNRAEVYRDKAGQWRWRIKASNGEVIADSGESYVNQTDCVAGLVLTTGSPPVIVQLPEK